MGRPNRTTERMRELLPEAARAFAELGYRRTTTAELARRCGVQETILYRLWPDKKSMFIAAIGYVYDLSASIWGKVLAEGDGERDAAELLLDYEAAHHGEFGLYRIIHAGLSEIDDAEVRAALGDMYARYHRFIVRQIAGAGKSGKKRQRQAELAAWAVIGLGSVANIGRELGLLNDDDRSDLMRRVGGTLLSGAREAD